MTQITAQAVKALREATDLPMMACKKALVEAEGDRDKAVAILKENAKDFQGVREKKETHEGRIFTKTTKDGSEVAMVEIQTESAPVATGQDIENFGNLLVQQLLEGSGAESPEDLLSQQSPDGCGKSLAEIYDDLFAKIRENIKVTKIARVSAPVGVYVHHDGKTAAFFQAECENAQEPILRDVAMHIAALQPTVIGPEELDADHVQAERDKLTEEARATGKPENIVDKIVDGRMKNFYVEEGVLMMQPFAKDDTKTVSQALAEKGVKPVRFERWSI